MWRRRRQWTLTAADLVRVVRTVHVVVALLVFSDALTVKAGELVRRTPDWKTNIKPSPLLLTEFIFNPHSGK